MKPIVHGLEKEFSGRVDFLYLDVSEARTSEVRARLGFKSTPHFMLLRADGSKVRDFVGMTERDVLATALEELARQRRG